MTLRSQKDQRTERMFRLIGDSYIDEDAVITFQGRSLSMQEKVDLFGILTDDFLRAFYRLSKEKQVAVRLRYGNNIYKWYQREKVDDSC